MKIAPVRDVVVAPSPGKGRGVFATRAYRRGELVEVAPVIVVSAADWEKMEGTVLDQYVFGWRDGVAIALGFGSLYNHSWSPNLEYLKRFGDQLIELVAIRDVAAGEELCSNYTASDPHRAGLWGHLV